MSVSVFSCGGWEGQVGQGEQRTAYFSLEFGLYCTYSAFVLINNLMGYLFQWADKNLKAREAISLSLNSSSHNFAVFSSRWWPGSPTPSVASLHDNACNHTSWLELFLWIWLRSTIFFISHWISAPSWYREYQTRPDWEEKSGALGVGAGGYMRHRCPWTHGKRKPDLQSSPQIYFICSFSGDCPPRLKACSRR